MKNFINPLILIAILSYIGGIICKLVPPFAEFCDFLSPVGTIAPMSFLRLSEASALIAIALALVQVLQMKKE